MAFNKEEVALFEAALDVIKERQRIETEWCKLVDINNALLENIKKLKQKSHFIKVADEFCFLPNSIEFAEYWNEREFRVKVETNEDGICLGAMVSKWYSMPEEKPC